MKSICFKKNTLITIEQLVCFFFRALIRGVKKMKSAQLGIHFKKSKNIFFKFKRKNELQIYAANIKKNKI